MSDCAIKHDCKNCTTRNMTEWRDLGAKELAILAKAKTSRTFEPGEIIFNQGDQAKGVHCIQSGLIGMRRISEDGKSVLIRLCAEGTTVGYGAFLSKTQQLNSAEVLTPSVVCFIHGSTVSSLLAGNPKIGERFLQHAIADQTKTETDHFMNLTKNVRFKLLHVLLTYYERDGYQDSTGLSTLELPILRRELAELVHAQPETLSRALRELQDEGLLTQDSKQFFFPDMKSITDEIRAF
jgi:CRP-like cAMP-binding protein